MAIATSTALAIASIASTVASVAAQAQAAAAQTEANKRQAENTMRAYAANLAQTNLEHEQEREAAMQKVQENNIAARAAASRSLVAAGEVGISGMSVDYLMSDIGNKSNRYNSSVITNYERTEAALNNQRENIYANAASTINGLKTPQQPNYIGAGLEIAKQVDKAKWFDK